VPRATKEEAEATAARVLDTARALFVARGYADVGLEEVAAEAGVTRGAVYHHYRNKKSLFEAVLAAVQAEVGAAIEVAAVGDPREQLERGCRAFLAAAVAPEVRRILLVDAPAVLGWAAWREHDAAGTRLLAEGVAAAGLAPAFTPLLNGALNEAALWIAASDDPARALAESWSAFQTLLPR
jgi:AcrR family transcriptional regulator